MDRKELKQNIKAISLSILLILLVVFVFVFTIIITSYLDQQINKPELIEQERACENIGGQLLGDSIYSFKCFVRDSNGVFNEYHFREINGKWEVVNT